MSEETRGKNIPPKAKIYFGISCLMHFTYGASTTGTIIARLLIDGILVQTYK